MPPATRFSADVSAHRVFEGVGLSMAHMKTIRQQVPGVTINDLILAVVGGALHRYLALRKELPAGSLLAAVPMTLRGEDKTQEGNRVGFTVMSVCSDIADPVERLLAIRGAGATAKRVTGAIGKDLAMNVLEVLPPPLSEVVLRNIRLPKLGVLVSNVRGSDVPLYMAGARAGRPTADQHRRRWHRSQLHRVQLRGHAVDLRGLVSRDVARPRGLRGLSARDLRRSQARRCRVCGARGTRTPRPASSRRR
jgi:hypothetical protein